MMKWISYWRNGIEIVKIGKSRWIKNLSKYIADISNIQYKIYTTNLTITNISNVKNLYEIYIKSNNKSYYAIVKIIFIHINKTTFAALTCVFRIVN